MLIEIRDLFSAAESQALCETLLAEPWVDGKVTAGLRSAPVKHNRQLPEDSPVASAWASGFSPGCRTTRCSCPPPCRRNLPAAVQPLSRRRSLRPHVDNAIRGIKGIRERVRTDISATLFLADPDSYDGGELVIRDTYGEHPVKLPAGHLLLYPAPACTRSTRSPVANGSPRSSGSKAWSAKTASAPCCWTWTWRSSA